MSRDRLIFQNALSILTFVFILLAFYSASAEVYKHTNWAKSTAGVLSINRCSVLRLKSGVERYNAVADRKLESSDQPRLLNVLELDIDQFLNLVQESIYEEGVNQLEIQGALELPNQDYVVIESSKDSETQLRLYREDEEFKVLLMRSRVRRNKEGQIIWTEMRLGNGNVLARNFSTIPSIVVATESGDIVTFSCME